MKQVKVNLDSMIKDSDGKDTDNPFTGSFELKLPKYKERIRLVKGLSFKLNEKQELVEADNYDRAEALADIAKDHLISLDVKKKGSKVKLTSFEDLEYDKDGPKLINLIGQTVLSGVSLSQE